MAGELLCYFKLPVSQFIAFNLPKYFENNQKYQEFLQVLTYDIIYLSS